MNEQEIGGESSQSVNMLEKSGMGLYHGEWGTCLSFFRTNAADMGRQFCPKSVFCLAGYEVENARNNSPVIYGRQMFSFKMWIIFTFFPADIYYGIKFVSSEDWSTSLLKSSKTDFQY